MSGNENLSYWRGPLESAFANGADGAEWADCGDSRIVESCASDSGSFSTGVCDLSPLPRTGAKGECAAAAPPPNTSAAFADGSLCCRLGADEILILASPDGAHANISESVMPSPRLIIPRRDSHCQIGLYGAAAKSALARLCAVPPPCKNELLQTRVADVSAIVVCEPRAAGAFYILTDCGYAMHLWEAVVAAVKSAGGGVAGWKQWRTLFAEK